MSAAKRDISKPWLHTCAHQHPHPHNHTQAHTHTHTLTSTLASTHAHTQTDTPAHRHTNMQAHTNTHSQQNAHTLTPTHAHTCPIACMLDIDREHQPTQAYTHTNQNRMPREHRFGMRCAMSNTTAKQLDAAHACMRTRMQVCALKAWEVAIGLGLANPSHCPLSGATACSRAILTRMLARLGLHGRVARPPSEHHTQASGRIWNPRPDTCAMDTCQIPCLRSLQRWQLLT